MTEWFRSWHGAPTDTKWLGVARKAGVAPGIVVAVAWALLDRASQAKDRGSIAGYDADGMACFFGCEAEQVEAIIAAMTDRGVLTADGRFTAWSERQPQREDSSTGRVQEHRKRKETQRNADETQCNATQRAETLDTDTDTDTERKKDAAPSAALDPPEGEPPDPEADLFRRGKEICGRTSGGLIKRVLLAKGGNVALARAALEQASTKQDPREYLGAVIQARDKPSDDARARGDAW